MTVFGLKVMACLCMLIDHIGYCGGIFWMRVIGRLAFPIYAFLIANGYRHTRNVPRYMLRLFCAAVLSEPCFDRFVSDTWFDPAYQNVLWTLLLGLMCLILKDWLCRIGKCGKWLYPLSVFLLCAAAVLARTDYAAVGVLTVAAFGAGTRSGKADMDAARHSGSLHGGCVSGFPGDGAPEPLACGLFVLVTCLRPLAFCAGILAERFGWTPLQTVRSFFGSFSEWDVVNLLRLAALIPLLLYNGEKGMPGKLCGSALMRYGFYLFYPVHMLLLAFVF